MFPVWNHCGRKKYLALPGGVLADFLGEMLAVLTPGKIVWGEMCNGRNLKKMPRQMEQHGNMRTIAAGSMAPLEVFGVGRVCKSNQR